MIQMGHSNTMRPQSLTHRPDSARIAYQGPLFKAWQWDQELYDGTTTRFELLTRRDTVLILPITTDRKVLLATEQQPGVRKRLHTIGGRVEDGETPEAAAARELREESGLAAGAFTLWASWQPLSKLDWAVYLFWAGGLVNVDQPNLDPGEDIHLTPIPADDLLEFRNVGVLQDMELEYQLGRACMIPEERAVMRKTFEQARQGGAA
jgi:8-oxo-dGTP pyrophosphatase MutT (NUDIX family)